jgi:hypothetical protein
MKRADMTCSHCIKFDAQCCRHTPHAVPILEPEAHWCAQGQWHQWSERYQEMEPYYWGEWHEVI